MLGALIRGWSSQELMPGRSRRLNGWLGSAQAHVQQGDHWEDEEGLLAGQQRPWRHL